MGNPVGLVLFPDIIHLLINKTQDGGLGLNQFPKRVHLAVPPQTGPQLPLGHVF